MSFWHRICYWNTRPSDIEAAWPCDERARPGEVSIFRAIDVEASQARVFRWLCQLKVAPYSYDWIDNFGRESPRQLTEGTDELAIGQTFMVIFELLEFEADRYITLSAPGRGSFGPVVVTYRVTPGTSTTGSPQTTRLLARLRMSFPDHVAGRAARAGLTFGDWVMMRKQFLTLKELAEADREPDSTD